MIREPFSFIDNDAFSRSGALKLYGQAELPRMPAAQSYEPGERRLVPAFVMTQEEEVQRFLQLNYAKKVFNSKLSSRRSRTLESWYDRVIHLREYLVRLNLPLVYSQVARNTHRFAYIDWDDAVSEGSLGLNRSIDGFDVNKRVKFSTYACQAILHSLSSVNAKAAKRRSRLVTVEMPDTFGDEGPSAQDDNADEVAALRHVLSENKASLSDTELMVLQVRFGLGGAEYKTLEELGQVVGVSKERVRQIQEKALSKLREAFAA